MAHSFPPPPIQAADARGPSPGTQALSIPAWREFGTRVVPGPDRLGAERDARTH